MTRRLDRNLRSGHRSEGAAIELLRALFAVAAVPQEEDFGLDAVCTLLVESGRFLLPEGSAFVQVKAQSVREWALDGDDYAWLRRLELPSFIASVDRREDRIELFSTHRVASRVDARSHSACVMYLDPTPCKIEDGVVHQYLGPPALSWDRKACEDPATRRHLSETAREWLRLESMNIRSRAIHAVQLLTWETNEAPVVASMGLVGHAGDLAADLEAARPYLFKLMSHVLMSERPDDLAALGSLTALLAWGQERVPGADLGNLPNTSEVLLRHAVLRVAGSAVAENTDNDPDDPGSRNEPAPHDEA